jgi:hypothetical protein
VRLHWSRASQHVPRYHPADYLTDGTFWIVHLFRIVLDVNKNNINLQIVTASVIRFQKQKLPAREKL